MTSAPTNPPRWTEWLLRRLLEPADRASTSGDPLEEYRARESSRGRFRANAWYCRRVLGILWREIWPGVLALAMLNVFLATTVFRPGHHAPHPAAMAATWLSVVVRTFWYGSVVGAPGVSLLDAAVYFVTAYQAAARTRLVVAGVLVAGATSIVGSLVLFIAAAAITPGLAVALVRQPPLVVILSAYLLVPLIYSSLVGIGGGWCGRWAHLRRDHLSPVP